MSRKPIRSKKYKMRASKENMNFLKLLSVSTNNLYLDIFISMRIFKAVTKILHILQRWELYIFVQIHKAHNVISELKCKHCTLSDDTSHHCW